MTWVFKKKKKSFHSGCITFSLEAGFMEGENDCSNYIIMCITLYIKVY